MGEQEGKLIPFPPLREVTIFVGPWISLDEYIARREAEEAAEHDKPVLLGPFVLIAVVVTLLFVITTLIVAIVK